MTHSQAKTVPEPAPAVSTSPPTPPLVPYTRPKVLVITGPTAVGKSSAALALCARLNGEIISADSVQVYKHLNIASNKSSAEERAQAPHHLLDLADPSEASFTAGTFFRHAREATQDVLARNHLPIVVGGTMMYVRWFLHGRPATPRATNEARKRAEALVASAKGDWSTALALLAARDPVRAERLFPNDWYRLTRALEVVETAGVAMSVLPQKGASPLAAPVETLDYDFRCVFLVGDRRATCRVIDERCETMIWPRAMDNDIHDPARSSVLVEVADLLVARRLRVESDSPCRAIGYRQTISYLARRALTHCDAAGDDVESYDATKSFRAYLDDFQTATRNYARQQIAWFRKEPSFHWVESGEQAVDTISHLFALSEEEFQKFCACETDKQRMLREETIAQGKTMKTYLPTQMWLIKESEEERAAVQLAEECARNMAEKIERSELQRFINVVDG